MNPRAPQRSPEGGFTMIEVMIALLLTAIAIMGILGLYTTSTRASGFSRHTTEATILGEDRIEQLRTQSPSVTILSPVVETGLDPQGKTGTGGIYTRQYTVAPDPTSTWALVTTSVTWNDDGVPHAVNLYSRRTLP